MHGRETDTFLIPFATFYGRLPEIEMRNRLDRLRKVMHGCFA